MNFSFAKAYSRFMWLQLCVMLLFVCVENGKLVNAEGRRPLYIVAHMVNSIHEQLDFLARGANAIEADVTFNSNGTIKNIYHGYPCDCLRLCDEKEDFAKYLNHMRDIVDPNHTNYDKSLTVLFLDLKLDVVSRSQKYKAGEEIAKHLITNLWNDDLTNPRINVVLSIGHTSDSEVVRGVRDTFTKSNRASAMNKLGFDVGLNDDLNNVRKMWSKLGVRSNRWQGDGITNCLRTIRDDTRLRRAIRIRDSSSGFIDKVYDWTVDITEQIRRSLRVGVDGILTNYPERVISVMQEKEFRDKYRLATVDDNPFSRITLPPPGRKALQVPNMNTYVATIREITIGVLMYLWDFYKLRLQKPGTLFPLLQDFYLRAAPLLRKYYSLVD